MCGICIQRIKITNNKVLMSILEKSGFLEQKY